MEPPFPLLGMPEAHLAERERRGGCVGPLRDLGGGPVADREVVGDVADYLTVCDRSAAKITQRADAPAPALTLGKVRLWHPEQWERWFHHQAGLDVADAGGPWNDGGDVTINWAATNA